MHVLWHPRSWSLRRSLVLGRNGTSNFEGYLLLRLRRLCLSISISYVVSKTLSTAQVGFCTRTNLVIPYDWSRSRILVSDLPAYLQQSKTQGPSKLQASWIPLMDIYTLRNGCSVAKCR